IYWGDGNVEQRTLPPGQAQFTLTGTHVYTEDGSYHVEVLARDADPLPPPASGFYTPVAAYGTATVSEAAPPRDHTLRLQGQPVVAVEGAAFSDQVLATVTAANAGALTAQINWGDGT